MIKKIFIGVLLAGLFGLLVLGAVNRTLAKSTAREPLALSENETERYGAENGNHGQTQGGNADCDDCDDCSHENQNLETRAKNNHGQNGSSHNSSTEGNDYQSGNQGRWPVSDTEKGRQPEGAPVNDFGTGLAKVEEWLTYSGTVITASDNLWVIELMEFGSLDIEGRTLSFLQEKGFAVTEGHALTVTGFMEGEFFEVGAIENIATGETITIREETGRPLWAGGRRGGGNQ